MAYVTQTIVAPRRVDGHCGLYPEILQHLPEISRNLAVAQPQCQLDFTPSLGVPQLAQEERVGAVRAGPAQVSKAAQEDVRVGSWLQSDNNIEVAARHAASGRVNSNQDGLPSAQRLLHRVLALRWCSNCNGALDTVLLLDVRAETAARALIGADH